MNTRPGLYDRIGVFDSGMGGLEFLVLLQKILPDEEIYYFADTVNNPYGTKTPKEIERYLVEIIEGMLARRMKLIIIACNTASVVYSQLPADHPLKMRLRRAGVRVVPMNTTELVAELHSLAPRRLWVLATELTVKSGAYGRMLAAFLPHCEIKEIAAQEWVERVERPDSDQASERLKRLESIERILGPHAAHKPDAVLLGCTHFPHMEAEIREWLGPDPLIVNPATAVAHFARNLLNVEELAAPPRGEERAPSGSVLFTNGDEKKILQQLVRMGYRGDISVRQIDIRNDLSGKAIDIIGFGLTGKSLVRYLLNQKPGLITVRDKNHAVSDAVHEAYGESVQVVTGEAYLSGLEHSDLVFRSPGVPLSLPQLKTASDRGAVMSSDIQLFLERAPGLKIGITGTNGKTTTTLLTHRILDRQFEGRAQILGNVGQPVLDDFDKLDARSACAIELSSFQLEELRSLPIRAGVLLNVTPDHLDRHGDMRGYAAAKGRIFTLLEEGSFAVYNIDDPVLINLVLPHGCRAAMMPFSRRHRLTEGAWLEGDDLVMAAPQLGRFVIKDYLKRKSFIGDHNLENVMAAALSTWLCGVEEKHIEETLLSFAGVKYRIELFHSMNGINFYDDSKGTNPDATYVALKTIKQPVRLVAGGVDKDCDFSDLHRHASGRVTKAYLFGPVAEKLQPALEQADPPVKCSLFESLEDATLAAATDAQSGEAVLFSPASASPPGQKYYQRGDRFKECVRKLGPDKRRERLLYIADPLAEHGHNHT